MLEAYSSVLNRIQNNKKWINFNIEKLKGHRKLFFRRSEDLRQELHYVVIWTLDDLPATFFIA